MRQANHYRNLINGTWVTGAFFVLAAFTLAQAQSQEPRVNPDAQVLADFKARVDAYVRLHDDAAKGAPPMKETNDPAKIVEAQKVLAEKIRAARASAKQGDIFTPAVSKKLRSLMNPELKGADGTETKAAIKRMRPQPSH